MIYMENIYPLVYFEIKDSRQFPTMYQFFEYVPTKDGVDMRVFVEISFESMQAIS